MLNNDFTGYEYTRLHGFNTYALSLCNKMMYVQESQLMGIKSKCHKTRYVDVYSGLILIMP